MWCSRYRKYSNAEQIEDLRGMRVATKGACAVWHTETVAVSNHFDSLDSGILGSKRKEDPTNLFLFQMYDRSSQAVTIYEIFIYLIYVILPNG